MPKKSKSSKNRKSAKRRNEKSPQTKEITEKYPDDDVASIKTENTDLETTDRPKCETPTSSGHIETLNKTLSPTLSDKTLSAHCEIIWREKSKSVESLVRSDFIETPLRKIFSDHCLALEVNNDYLEFILAQFFMSRRSYFKVLYQKADKIVDFMEFLTTIRNENKESHLNTENNRWKQRDSNEWFSLHKTWGIVQENLKMFIAVMEYTYDDFDTNIDISTTIEDFHAFVHDLTEIFTSIEVLLKLSINCFYKFSRFCATNNESTYLRNVADYRQKFTYFQRCFKVELDKFVRLQNAMIFSSEV